MVSVVNHIHSFNNSLNHSRYPEKTTCCIGVGRIVQRLGTIDVVTGFIGAENVFYTSNVTEGLNGLQVQLIEFLHHAKDIDKIFLQPRRLLRCGR